MPERLRRSAPLLVAAVAGPLVGVALLGSTDAGLLARVGALSVSAVLVVRGLTGAIGLARDEWRRTAPSRDRYVRVVARFAVALLLVVLATT